MESEDTKQLRAVADGAARTATAAGCFAADVVCLLSQHPGVDRRLLLEQMQSLYADSSSDETFQLAYNNMRERVTRYLREIEQGHTPGRDSA